MLWYTIPGLNFKVYWGIDRPALHHKNGTLAQSSGDDYEKAFLFPAETILSSSYFARLCQGVRMAA